ncbi:hypothetical protein MRB53_020828 [Persea americana]|uniref:Uncharacterized protein n=1 Tax=Persea americana TaxID=3435 RepID=A0ACC2L1V9_PERAE|nr:hypothetical protein MRB53_020828 [Persea americana]
MVVRIVVFGVAERPKGGLAEIVGSNLLHTKTDEIVVFCGEISSEERRGRVGSEGTFCGLWRGNGMEKGLGRKAKAS